jgi:putative toxin-antitoxin system antitoxin component (TIGR02293 family)
VPRPAKRQPAVLSYLGVYRASPFDRITLIKQGLPAAEAKRIITELAIGQGAALKALKLSPATVNKKAKQDHTLSPAESERVIGIARLVGQVEAMVQESGDPQGFDAAAWMSRWLKEPLPALGGARPIDLMDTMEGQALVSTALAQMQSGAYA